MESLIIGGSKVLRGEFLRGPATLSLSLSICLSVVPVAPLDRLTVIALSYRPAYCPSPFKSLRSRRAHFAQLTNKVHD